MQDLTSGIRSRFLSGLDRSREMRRRVTRTWLFLGPAFVAAVAYVDPGNFATNIQAGAEEGYRLVWVVVAANIAAMVIQIQSAKLGLVTGRSGSSSFRPGSARRWSRWRPTWPSCSARG
jgi:Mn2+/Fe2+ NRAMP family transporter